MHRQCKGSLIKLILRGGSVETTPLVGIVGSLDSTGGARDLALNLLVREVSIDGGLLLQAALYAVHQVVNLAEVRLRVLQLNVDSSLNRLTLFKAVGKD